MTDKDEERDDAMSLEVDTTTGKAAVTFTNEPQIIDGASSPPPYEQEAVEGETPLLHSMMEVMALSYLVFMYADLRALSSTGRISTRFEHIAVESDYSPRYEADFISGDQVQTGDAARQGKKKKCDGGLSTAQIMAVMLLEIQSCQQRKEKEKDGNLLGSSKGSNLGSNPETHDRKIDRKDMTKLLRVYASIIGADLKKNVGEIEVTKSVRDLASSQSRVSEIPAPEWRFKFSKAVERIMQMKDGGQKEDQDSSANNNDENDAAVDTEDAGEEEADLSRSTPSTNNNVPPPPRFGRSVLMSMINKQEAAIRLPNADDENEDLEMITNNIFSSAACGLVEDSNGNGSGLFAVSGEDMQKIMFRAVTSRIYSKLDFMGNFFREGTVSHLMALSNVRVCWFNDWYPAKELTYGICVDETKKRILIVFRGAITTKDWSKAMDFNFATAPNPVAGGPHTVKLHNGFYSYLFRERKDTGTTKYHQIAEVAHRIGTENFGEDYNLVVCGHSLGAALSTVFSFWASTDPRFTRNGPIQVFTFGSPYVGSNDFADEWRRQEAAGKLLYARFYNHNDLVTYGPSSNLWPTSRGSRYRHVGLSVAIHPVPRHLKGLRRGFEPGLSYVPNETRGKSYCRGLGNTWALHLGIPWNIQKRHTLQEMIKRVADGKREEERSGSKRKGSGFDLMNNSLNVLYRIEANL